MTTLSQDAEARFDEKWKNFDDGVNLNFGWHERIKFMDDQKAVDELKAHIALEKEKSRQEGAKEERKRIREGNDRLWNSPANHKSQDFHDGFNNALYHSLHNVINLGKGGADFSGEDTPPEATSKEST